MTMDAIIRGKLERQIKVRGLNWLPCGVECRKEDCFALREEYHGIVKKCSDCGDEEYYESKKWIKL